MNIKFGNAAKTRKTSVASLVAVIAGCIGCIAYLVYFLPEFYSRFGIELIELIEEDATAFFDTFFFALRAIIFGFGSLGVIILGVILGVYTIRKTEKKSKSYKLAFAGIIVGVVGLTLTIISISVYSAVMTFDFIPHVIEYYF